MRRDLRRPVRRGPPQTARVRGDRAPAGPDELSSDDPRATDAYDYAIPDELIAREPAARREAARLLVVGRGDALEHRTFADFPSLLRAGDVLVINETRVV
ncbi:MAG: S-adenosylmethionine:tRNA ribosyltransferase-isomerase, partial [Candidatus Eremiobacteraeota bacterium]|nr:S-adenosylmethionine:tRNA ribosyltransferase-isomerase [Candidatus Eremiobacteraeota bacterium]